PPSEPTPDIPRRFTLTWPKMTTKAIVIAALAMIVATLLWGLEVHHNRTLFHNRTTIYAHQVAPTGPRLCLFTESDSFSICAVGPHSHGGAFYPVTVLVFQNSDTRNAISP
ncbi:MAG: hypothetical protein AAFS10_16595, partial [Myxococcota bacterium]